MIVNWVLENGTLSGAQPDGHSDGRGVPHLRCAGCLWRVLTARRGIAARPLDCGRLVDAGLVGNETATGAAPPSWTPPKPEQRKALLAC
jgi:hypothetical protein